jgi:cyclic dehypoxanthinyl futalosine synthase
MIDAILRKSLAGQRIRPDEALELLKSSDWTSIIKAGHEKRNQMHDKNRVSYTVFRIINYTNRCAIKCSFCSFREGVNGRKAFTLTLEQIDEIAEETAQAGVNQIFFQGGVNPELPLSYYIDALRRLTITHGMEVRGFSPVEIWHLAEREKTTVSELLSALKAGGLGSLPGAGAELLTEKMRRVLTPQKLNADQWCQVMGEAHKLKLPGSATIVFGSVEEPEDIVEHFTLIRKQQDLAGGFLSFIPWTFQPQTKYFPVRHVRSWEYLRLLSVSRLFFDNIPNIEASVMVFGKELAELALLSGANDISSVVLEENVLDSRGIETLEEITEFITNAGFEPVRRSMNYEMEQ